MKEFFKKLAAKATIGRCMAEEKMVGLQTAVKDAGMKAPVVEIVLLVVAVILIVVIAYPSVKGMVSAEVSTASNKILNLS